MKLIQEVKSTNFKELAKQTVKDQTNEIISSAVNDQKSKITSVYDDFLKKYNIQLNHNGPKSITEFSHLGEGERSRGFDLSLDSGGNFVGDVKYYFIRENGKIKMKIEGSELNPFHINKGISQKLESEILNLAQNYGVELNPDTVSQNIELAKHKVKNTLTKENLSEVKNNLKNLKFDKKTGLDLLIKKDELLVKGIEAADKIADELPVVKNNPLVGIARARQSKEMNREVDHLNKRIQRLKEKRSSY